MRRDSLFKDPYARRLAGHEGMENPMGSWIMVPRTVIITHMHTCMVLRAWLIPFSKVFGDQFIQKAYTEGNRQIVLLGAGMDARAWRMPELPEATVFEVDQSTTFQVKEPLMKGEPLGVKARHTVALDFDQSQDLRGALVQQGFSPQEPTTWVLEGLLESLRGASKL